MQYGGTGLGGQVALLLAVQDGGPDLEAAPPTSAVGETDRKTKNAFLAHVQNGELGKSGELVPKYAQDKPMTTILPTVLSVHFIGGTFQ